MSLNSNFFLRSVVTSSCLFVISVLLYANHSASPNMRPSDPTVHKSKQFNLTAFLGSDNILTLPFKSLVAVLPITRASPPQTLELLSPFLIPQEHVREVIVVCPDAIASHIRLVLQGIFGTFNSIGHPDISVRPLPDFLDQISASLRAAADITTDWVLILDDSGLNKFPSSVLATLLHPPRLALPFGPRGVPLLDYSATHDPQLGQVSPAEYLIPPFITPSFLLSSFASCCKSSFSWMDFGHHVAGNLSQTTGGLIFKVGTSLSLMPSSIEVTQSHSVNSTQNNVVFDNGPLSWSAHFVFLFPLQVDLRRAMPLICNMRKTEETLIRILIYDDMSMEAAYQDFEEQVLESHQCVVRYDVLTGRTPLSFTREGSALLYNWLQSEENPVHVVITLREMDPLVGFLQTESTQPSFASITIILIPRMDLDHTQWMSSLSLEEWKNWHSPRIDVSVISKNRPQSLSRLLRSLSSARYFGDSLDLRINIDQDCDTETLHTAASAVWIYGSVFLHRRIIHGGLLPAVLESWYPKNNDSYGVLLEDDVEVSPLFYAWIKMTVLRYRYGEATDRASNLFGISLYQQKHLELLPGGRRPFDPRSFFSEAGLESPTTPYLSQVPCSWGAVYFPDHWREFHDYLSFRFAQSTVSIEDNVVEDVRSNHWSKSWKRYFIELIYLRGYVMLYPNFERFLSLSTNHLEIGSHVKIRSTEHEDLFFLPLMQLQGPQETCKLLDLPKGRLPRMDLLPVLNLTGSLTSLDEIVQRGELRRLELTQCSGPAELYDIRSLMCTGGQKESASF